MLRDVKTTITDGGLMSSVSGAGIHVKIGVSPVTATEPIEIRGSMNPRKIQSLLGLSPLADAVMDSVEHGASTLYCIPVAATTDGTTGSVTKTGTGTGTLTVSGKPNNAYKVVIKITRAGDLNEAAMRYSLDGGITLGDEMVLPLGGVVAINPTGLTLTFAPGESGFAAGDQYTFDTVAPGASNEAILTAIEKIRHLKATVEFAHIVGPSDKTLWAAAGVVAQRFFEEYHRPLFFVFEAPVPTTGQTAEAYASSLISDRKGIDNKYLQVIAARGAYKRMDGTTQEMNLAGVICGLYARASVQQSIGETKSFNIADSKLLNLFPAGIEDELEALDAAGYLTLRRYEGLAGYYVTNARMFAPVGSDYQYAERVRVSNKITREVRKAMLLQLQANVDVANLDAELEAISRFAEAPLDRMVEAGEISAARVIIPEDQDILSTDTLELIIRYVPIGYIREIQIDLGMENPYA